MVFYRLNELTARLYAFSQMIFERRLACLGTDTFRIYLEHPSSAYLPYTYGHLFCLPDFLQLLRIWREGVPYPLPTYCLRQES